LRRGGHYREEVPPVPGDREKNGKQVRIGSSLSESGEISRACRGFSNVRLKTKKPQRKSGVYVSEKRSVDGETSMRTCLREKFKEIRLAT